MLPPPDEHTPPRNRLPGKVAIVAGAGSVGTGWGNGKAAAFVYGKEGAKVLCVDMSLDAAAETVELIKAAGGEASAYAGDMRDEAVVQSMVDTCVERYGRLDILHNNIGLQGTGRSLDSITVDDWNFVFGTNLTTTMLTCRAAVPVMIKQKFGTIVNIASIGAIRHLNVPMAVYAATKGAMVEFTRNIAIQHAGDGIRANCVLPGYIDTPFILRIVDGKPNYQHKGYDTADAYRAARDAVVPTGRMGTGFDVAYAALFLASDEASYVTGTTLVTDGGVTSTCPGT